MPSTPSQDSFFLLLLYLQNPWSRHQNTTLSLQPDEAFYPNQTGQVLLKYS